MWLLTACSDKARPYLVQTESTCNAEKRSDVVLHMDRTAGPLNKFGIGLCRGEKGSLKVVPVLSGQGCEKSAGKCHSIFAVSKQGMHVLSITSYAV